MTRPLLTVPAHLSPNFRVTDNRADQDMYATVRMQPVTGSPLPGRIAEALNPLEKRGIHEEPISQQFSSWTQAIPPT